VVVKLLALGARTQALLLDRGNPDRQIMVSPNTIFSQPVIEKTLRIFARLGTPPMANFSFGGGLMQVKSNDRNIEEEAHKRLQQSLYPEVKRIACNYRDSTLTLIGTVSSFYARRIAEDLVKDLQGIEKVSNELVIVMPPEENSAASKT
jgi:BON domain-containing protein